MFLKLFSKKYTIMVVPFNQEKVFSFNVSHFGLFIASISFLFIFLFSIFTYFSDYNFRNMRLERNNYLSVRETLSLFNKTLEQNEQRYKNLRKNVHRFVQLYDPVFPDRYYIPENFYLQDELDFLIYIVSNFSDFHTKVQEFLSRIPSIFPVVGGGKVTSGFGARIDPLTMTPAFHTGVDIPKVPGTPIRAAGNGVVITSHFNSTYGFMLSIEHSYGFVSTYAHMLSMPLVQKGDYVKQGQIIGYVGSTGRSVGYHLHYEIRSSGKLINPIDYLFLKRVDF